MDSENRVVVGKIVVESEVSEELVDGILDAAFNWAPAWYQKVYAKDPLPEGANYMSEVCAKGGTIVIVIDEEGDGSGQFTEYEVTNQTIITGLERYVKDGGRTPYELEEDPPDAVESDIIVQWALFNELIYG